MNFKNITENISLNESIAYLILEPGSSRSVEKVLLRTNDGKVTDVTNKEQKNAIQLLNQNAGVVIPATIISKNNKRIVGVNYNTKSPTPYGKFLEKKVLETDSMKNEILNYAMQ
jgi:hypothetical protein